MCLACGKHSHITLLAACQTHAILQNSAVDAQSLFFSGWLWLLQRLYLAKHLLEAFLLRGWCHLLWTVSACPAWCCRMISVVNCDDLALYRRISLYRRFLSSGFILSTSAAIILPWYTMDLKNLEAFLPGPRQASERGVCPLAGSKWGSAFDTVFSVWRLHVRSKCIFWHIIYTCWLQRDTVLLHLLPQTPHDLRAVSLFFPWTNCTRVIQSNTSAWQCVAYFPTMIFYIYCILSYMVYYVALSLCGYKCPKVYKQRILKHPVQQNANITATLYCPTSFYIHYMYYIYTINIYIYI